jgi:hypothetical protein
MIRQKNVKMKISAVVTLSSLFVLPALLGVGCGSSDDETTSSSESVSEMAGSTVAGAAQSSESSGSMAMSEGRSGRTLVARIDELLFSNATAANPACPTLAAATCVG